MAADTQWVTGIGPFVIGIAVVALLIGLVVRKGGKGRSRPPRPDEQPRRPASRSRDDDRGTSGGPGGGPGI
ncbi:DUF6479 family protein [Streptomyces sp. NPDC020965]|uniref:DUF6479 family protein n=1 Tax=Streptomyces sp. NPDC020965 TaxID=3365105 RepID=UPI00378AB5E5